MDRISALMDGELDAHHSGQQLARLKQDAEARACWDTYHLIGDALRGEAAGAGVTTGLPARLAERLQQEPTVLAPRRMPARRVTTYALSAAASVSAVALVGWMAFVNNPQAPGLEAKAPAAAAVAPVATAPSPPVQAQLANLPSDGRMNEYVIAHQEFSPSTTLQGLAPYIRGVSASQTGKGQE